MAHELVPRSGGRTRGGYADTAAVESPAGPGHIVWGSKHSSSNGSGDSADSNPGGNNASALDADGVVLLSSSSSRDASWTPAQLDPAAVQLDEGQQFSSAGQKPAARRLEFQSRLHIGAETREEHGRHTKHDSDSSSEEDDPIVTSMESLQLAGDANLPEDAMRRQRRRRKPCKSKRDRYRRTREQLEAQIHVDPYRFNFDAVELPNSIATNEKMKFKLRACLMLHRESVMAARFASENGARSSSQGEPAAAAGAHCRSDSM